MPAASLASSPYFCKNSICTGESNLGDVAFYLILGHTDAVVRNNQLLFLAVDAHLHPRLVAVLLRRLSDAA